MRRLVVAAVALSTALVAANSALAERHMMSCRVEEDARTTAVVAPTGSLRPTGDAAVRITSALGAPVFVGTWGAGAPRGTGAAFPLNEPQPVGNSCIATFSGASTGGDEGAARDAKATQLQSKVDQLEARVAQLEAELKALKSQGAAPP